MTISGRYNEAVWWSPHVWNLEKDLPPMKPDILEELVNRCMPPTLFEHSYILES